MGALLVDRWLDGLEAIPILDEASIALVREKVRAEAALAELPKPATEAMVVVASELARNHRAHAFGGRIALRRLARDGVVGLEIIATDSGPGISDPERALAGDETSIGGSLGIGLSGVLRMAQEVDIDVRQGEGTALWARKFASTVPRRREVAIYGRTLTGESVSGDDAAFARTEETLTIAVLDGLGHGPPAREASRAGIDAARALGSRSLSELFDAAGTAMRRTRGAVIAVARIDERTMTIEHAGIGNIRTQIIGPKHASVLSSAPGVLGHAEPARRRLREEHVRLEPQDIVVMSTDGIAHRATLANTSELLRKHPMFAAHALSKAFGKTTDDALVLVAR